jgi:hypothetical protein
MSVHEGGRLRLLNRNSDHYGELMALPAAPLRACAIEVCIGLHAQMVVPRINGWQLRKSKSEPPKDEECSDMSSAAPVPPAC